MTQSTLITGELDAAALADGHWLPTEAAYQKTLPEILAVPDDDVLPINVDILGAVTVMKGALPRIRAFRPRIENEWRNFNFDQFDKIEQYALALMHAQSLYRSSVAPKGAVSELVSQLNLVRDRMLANAESLASLDLLPAEALENIKKVPGHRALAMDVLTLCSVYRDSWKNLEGKTPYALSEQQRVGQLALELLDAIGEREQGGAPGSSIVSIRQKAFTLFVRAYEAARRAVLFLEGEVNGDDVAPSLYAGRGTRRRAEVEAELQDARLTPPGVAVGSNPQQAGGPAGPAATPIVIDNAAGLPVDDPFASTP